VYVDASDIRGGPSQIHLHMSVDIDSDRGELRQPAGLWRSGGSTVITVPADLRGYLSVGTGNSIELHHTDAEDPLTRELWESGNSQVVTLAPEWLAEAGLSDGDSVTLAVEFGASKVEVRSEE